jgi:hypothetical protein
MNKTRFALAFFVLLLIEIPISSGESANNKLAVEKLPALDMSNITYKGAFRIPIATAGDSRMAYSQGTFTLASDNQSIFVTGHIQHQAISQLSIPKILDNQDITELQMAKVLQPFSKIFGRAATGNKQGIDKITGLEHIFGQLIVNGVEYYDADANATDTTLIVRDSSKLLTSKVDGFFRLKGGAHAAGWISIIPQEWRSIFAAKFMSGFASTYAINGRNSIGPTAFTFFPEALLDSTENRGAIITEQFLGYSLEHPLHTDRYNSGGSNNLWTEVSTAIYGFIVPGTSSYLVVGNSGGHNSGIDYKIRQDNGKLCGGPCSKKAADNYNYFWIWDVFDMVKVGKGELQPYQPRPVKYGVFDNKRSGWRLIGADYDSVNSLLYLMYKGRDKNQSKYESAPLMVVYHVASKLTTR